MLIRFNVANFLSFDNEQEFSMIPGKVDKNKDRLIRWKNMNVLNFCALYGANASGKSNLTKAIDVARKIILNGIINLDRDMYCKIRETNKDVPSKFEFEIKSNNLYYAYGFSVNFSEASIIGEWLYEITPKREIMLFERDMLNKNFKYDIKFESERNKSKFDVYSSDIMNMNDVLLVSEISRKKLSGKDFNVFNEVFAWFKNTLNIIYPHTEIGPITKMFSNQGELDIVKLLNYFDTGISEYKLVETSEEEIKKYLPSDEYQHLMQFLEEPFKHKKVSTAYATLQTPKQLFVCRYDDENWSFHKLLFKHGTDCEAMFEYGEESDGTRRLIELLGVIHGDNDGKVFIIDELDRSLHPQMTKKFVETFFKLTKGKNTQLFITTHESSLLDLKLLRRDEIWFVERDKNYASKLYSLENFKVRYDKKVEKDYLEGRYGAVPVFKNFESFIGDLNEECKLKNS